MFLGYPQKSTIFLRFTKADCRLTVASLTSTARCNVSSSLRIHTAYSHSWLKDREGISRLFYPHKLSAKSTFQYPLLTSVDEEIVDLSS